jgi:hypothetical protein
LDSSPVFGSFLFNLFKFVTAFSVFSLDWPDFQLFSPDFGLCHFSGFSKKFSKSFFIISVYLYCSEARISCSTVALQVNWRFFTASAVALA